MLGSPTFSNGILEECWSADAALHLPRPNALVCQALEEYAEVMLAAGLADRDQLLRELPDLFLRPSACCDKPWHFLLRDLSNPKFTLDLMFNRMVFEQISIAPFSLHRFTNHKLWSDVCGEWFDGSLMTKAFPLLAAHLCTEFAQHGFNSILQTALQILNLVHTRNAPSFEDEADLNAYYSHLYGNAPKLWKLEYYQALLQKEEVAGFTMRNTLPLYTAGLFEYCQAINPDWVGFDLDFTLVEMDEEERLNLLIWHSVRQAFLSKTTWPLLSRLVFTKFFAQNGPKLCKLLRVDKNTIVDIDRGNLLVMDPFRKVHSALHGATKQVATYEVDISTTSSARGDRFAYVQTLFETPLAFMFAHCVDILDELGEETHYRLVFNSLREAFQLAQSPHFKHGLYVEMLKSGKAVRRQHLVAQWLEKIRAQGRRLFLMSDAKETHVNTMMARAFGRTWRDLFDLIIVDARKDEYFNPNLDDVEEYEYARYEEKYCTGGNIHAFQAFTGRRSRVVYFGDNVRKDVALPAAFANWRTVFVIGPSSGRAPTSSSRRSFFGSKRAETAMSWRDYVCFFPRTIATANKTTAREEEEKDVETCAAHFTLNDVKLFHYAQFAVPTIEFCAQHGLFVKRD